MLSFFLFFSFRGLNTWLGSQLLTEAGFILNNAAANGGINEEGKPFSLSAPVVAIESDEICGRRLVLGTYFYN